jgi:3,4-dihydroxyphenylacetate 2,3-dioxygenase
VGEIVGAGLLSHVPTIMLPESSRRELNEGKEISLVTGLRRLREEVFERLDYDTVIVFDSHWATTVEFVVTSHERRTGLLTSEELPRGVRQVPYEFYGDPELANAVASFSAKRETWITAIDDPCLPIYYATVNMWHYLGVPGKRWLSVGVCQSGDQEDHLRLGRAVADAVEAVDRKVLVIASGALSHTFWPLREIRDHEMSDPAHVISSQARSADLERIAWFEAGRHDRVLETMPEFRLVKPEAGFGHYLMMIGALGEERCVAPGRRFGEYENSVGTGQVHVWFDRPVGGWTG